jgi:hypothetical protein
MANDTLIAIKGKLRSPAESFFGLFVVILNSSQGKVSTANIIMTMTAEIYSFNLKDSWSEMDSRIQRLRYENKFAQSITLDLQEKFNELSADSKFFSALNGCVENKDANALKKVFFRMFREYFKDLDIEADYEEIEHRDQESIRRASGAAVNESSNDSAHIPPGAKNLDISLVLSPTGGTLVTNLEIDEEIYVRIKPDGAAGTTYLQDHDLIKEGNVSSVRAKVTAVQKTTKGTHVVVRLDKNIYGSVLEEERVLVKTKVQRAADEGNEFQQRQGEHPGGRQAPQNAANRSSLMHEIPTSPKVLWGGAILLAFLLGLFLYLVFGG